MHHRNFCRLTALIFALVALAHALRLYNGWMLQLGPYAIPPALSWVGLLLAAGLSLWGFRAARR